MNSSPEQHVVGELETLAKIINDLDGLLKALRSSSDGRTLWERQLCGDVAVAERHLQILRMTVSMDRPPLETSTAAADLATSLRASRAAICKSRADAETRAAITLASVMAINIEKLFRRPR